MCYTVKSANKSGNQLLKSVNSANPFVKTFQQQTFDSLLNLFILILILISWLFFKLRQSLLIFTLYYFEIFLKLLQGKYICCLFWWSLWTKAKQKPRFWQCQHYLTVFTSTHSSLRLELRSDLQAHNAQDESDFMDLRPDMLKLKTPARGTLNQSN